MISQYKTLKTHMELHDLV